MRFLAVISALNVFLDLGGTNDYYGGYGARDGACPRGSYTGNDDHHDESSFYGHFADNTIGQRDAFDTDYITGSYGMERDHDHVPPPYTDYPHGYHKYDGPEGYGYSADESEYKDVHQPTHQRLAPHSFEAPILPYQPEIIMTQGEKQSNGAVSTTQSLSTQNPTITQTQLTGSTLQSAKPPSEVEIIPETTDIKNQTSQEAKTPPEALVIPKLPVTSNQTTNQDAKPASEVAIIPQPPDISGLTTKNITKEVVTLSLETLATTPKSSPNANQTEITEITHASETPLTEQPDE